MRKKLTIYNQLMTKELKQAILSLINSEFGIIVVDKNDVIIAINSIAEKYIELSTADILGKNFNSYLPLQSLQTSIKSRQRSRCKLDIGDKNFYLNIIPMFMEEEALTVITWDDISSSDDQSESQALMEKQLDNLIDSIYDGIVISDAKGYLLKINKAYEFIAGVTKPEFIGKHVQKLVEEGYFDKTTMTATVITTNKSHSMMQKLVSGRTALISGMPVYDSNNELWRVIVTVRDMSELEKLKNQLLAVEAENINLKKELNTETVVHSENMVKMFDLAKMVAKTDATVLITGESGVGKEILTRYIHDNSSKKNNPFIPINCGAIPESLLESELFGYEKGAFSGASTTGKKGLLDSAHNGTFVFDEIGELPLALQVKLLRLLQNKEFFRVGGTNSINADIRFIASTNQNLQELVKEGRFRADLFYRLNVVNIHIPPIRDRKEEIAPLALTFLKRFNEKYNQSKRLGADVSRIMYKYDWPGNIREIQNVVEHMVVTCPHDLITKDYLPGHILTQMGDETKEKHRSLKYTLDELEKELLLDAYKRAGDTRTTAKILGISQSSVVKKMKKHGISCSH